MSDTTEVAEFDLTVETWPFKLKQPDGTTRYFELRTIHGKERDGYLNNLGSKMGGAGKTTTVKNFDGLQSNLLARCTYEVKDPDGPDPEAGPLYNSKAGQYEPRKVPEAEIQTWKASVIEQIYQKARQMNGLDKKAKVEAKND